MTIEHNALRVMTSPDIQGIQYLAVCDECGALLLHPERHETTCPRIMPPKPEPITPDRHEWAKIIHAHRPERVSYKPDAGVVCICGKFHGAPFGHSQHVAAMIANYVEANR